MTAGLRSFRLAAIAALFAAALAVPPFDPWTDDDFAVDETRAAAVVSQESADASGDGFAGFEARFGASFRTKNVVMRPRRVRDLPSFVTHRFIQRKPFYAAPLESPLPRGLIRLDPREAEYLFQVAEQARRGIVEVGRFRGGSTFLLAWANRGVPIWSIDIHPHDDDLVRQLLAQQGIGGNVELIVGDSQRDDFPQIGEYDLLFVDGDHSYAGCTRDLEQHFPKLAPGGQLVLHDCSRPSVQSAIRDFAAREHLLAVRSPDLPRAHWRTEHGSIAHFVKLA